MMFSNEQTYLNLQDKVENVIKLQGNEQKYLDGEDIHYNARDFQRGATDQTPKRRWWKKKKFWIILIILINIVAGVLTAIIILIAVIAACTQPFQCSTPN